MNTYPDREHEKRAYARGFQCVVGIDEAGRGPLAGPVVAAACYIPLEIELHGINDSKKLSPLQRSKLFAVLTSHPQICYGVGIVENETIDAINILQATIVAMQQAVNALSCPVDHLLVDGLRLPHAQLQVEKVIKGDALSQCIAAASIIAKETRDRIMCNHASNWPHYGFEKHKGYGTRQHMQALAQHGPCPIHRTSFAPIRQALPQTI